MPAAGSYRDVHPGLLNGLLYFAVVLFGCGYIVFSKLQGFSALLVTTIPIVIMLAYALMLAFARLFRLRDDQSGDNLYYLGFLFTLTSLAVSLYQFSATGSAEQIVQNFGVAIASTISGIALRIFFNQMRRDPIEVEHAMRLELAEASRRVKRELEGTVVEFSYFRRATQQSISDALDEVNDLLRQAKDRLTQQLDDFAMMSSKPLEEASKRSGETIEDLNSRMMQTLGTAANQISDQAADLSRSIATITQSIDGVVSRLSATQLPDQTTEAKLAPLAQGLTRAINAFSESADAQARTVEAYLEQTQLLANAVAILLTEIRGADSTRGPSAAVEARAGLRSRSGGRAIEPAIQKPLHDDMDKSHDG
jgi:uncharacterized protein YoxC